MAHAPVAAGGARFEGAAAAGAGYTACPRAISVGERLYYANDKPMTGNPI